MKKKRSLQNRRFAKDKSLPPHSWETHRLANAGEANKTFVAILVSIGAVIVLSLFLFFSSTFVGKAIQTAEGNLVDIVATADGTLLVQATLAAPTTTNGVYFTLQLEDGDLCALLDPLDERVTNRLWNEFYEVSCSDGTLRFADGTLSDTNYYGGTFPITEFQPASLPLELEFTTDTFDMYDSVTGADLFPASDEEGSFTITATPGGGQGGDTPGSEQGSAGSPYGGGGGGCVSRWSCGDWSQCQPSLQKTRSCVDLNRCRGPRVENVSCTPCAESWICTEWSSCVNSKNTRVCVDEHACGSTSLKPEPQKFCEQTVIPGPQPVRVQPQLPAPVVQRPQPVFSPPVAPPTVSFWTKYKPFIIIIPSALIVVVLIVFTVAHFLKPKQVVYNLDDLKNWIAQEKTMGTSNKDISQILAQHTGWSKEEIEKTFAELSSQERGSVA